MAQTTFVDGCRPVPILWCSCCIAGIVNLCAYRLFSCPDFSPRSQARSEPGKSGIREHLPAFKHLLEKQLQ